MSILKMKTMSRKKPSSGKFSSTSPARRAVHTSHTRDERLPRREHTRRAAAEAATRVGLRDGVWRTALSGEVRGEERRGGLDGEGRVQAELAQQQRLAL